MIVEKGQVEWIKKGIHRMNTLDTGFQNEFLHTTFNCFSFTLTYYILIEIWITGVKIESILNVLNEY